MANDNAMDDGKAMKTQQEYADSEQKIKALEAEIRRFSQQEIITRRLDKAFRHQTEILNIMTGQMEDMVYYKDRYFRYIFSSNRYCEKVLKTSPKECIGKTDNEIAPLHKPVLFEAGFGEILANSDIKTRDSGNPMRFTEIVKIEDQRIYLDTHKTPIFDENGNFAGIVGCSRDITSRILAGKKMAEQEELLRCLVDSIPAEIYFKNTQLRYLTANKAFLQAHGLEQIPLEGKTDLELLPQDKAAAILQQDQQVISSGKSLINHETPRTTTAGEQKWLMVSKIPYRDDDDQVAGIVGITMDITDRKQAEQAVLKRDKILQAVFSSAEHFLKTSDWRGEMNAVLQKIGLATEVSRVSIFENTAGDKDAVMMRRIASWYQQGRMAEHFQPELKELSYREAGFERWLSQLSAGEMIYGNIHDFPPSEKKILKFQGVKSVLIVPVILREGLWGFMEFGELVKERQWLPLEVDLLKAAANTLGAAIQRKQAEDRLRQAKQAAEVASHAKDRFIANMSHEFRTPMNAVIGFTDLALTTELSEPQCNYLTKVSSAARDLLNILDNMLIFSNIETGETLVQKAAFKLTDILEQLLRRFAAPAYQKGLDLVIDLGADIPVELIGDGTHLCKILENLLGNAIKFTERGEIVVSVACQRASMKQLAYRFSVADTGIGISPENIALLFEPFSQIDASSTRKFGGAGIGLAQSKKLIELMGGKISVASDPGRGSVFEAEVPFELQADKPVKKLQSKALSRLSALAADNGRRGMKVLIKQLTALGMKVRPLSSPADILGEMLAENDQCRDFDLLILDGLPFCPEALDTARRIHHHEAFQHLLVFILQPGTDSQHRPAVPLGDQIWSIEKPVDFSRLPEAFKTAGSGRKPASNPGVPAAKARLNHAAQKKCTLLVHEIKQLLLERDIEAENRLAALIAAIGETPLKSELDKLERHIAAYHFPEALSALSQIAQEMEIADITSASADSDDGGETRS